VIYPDVEESRVGPPRIEYLQYLLGERLEYVNMHRTTAGVLHLTGGRGPAADRVGFSFIR
jgi:hypothetical protein